MAVEKFRLSLFVSILLVSSACSSSSSDNNSGNSGGQQTTVSSTPSSKSDNFDGNGVLQGFTTNNESALPDVARVDGRYRANLQSNVGDVTLHFNNFQGRLDAKLLTFPFEFIARNIGIGLTSNSQIPEPPSGSSYIFAGVQVHVTDLNSRNSSHIVVGHRGGTVFTIEGKNTVNGASTVDDIGANRVTDGRADIRVVGHQDGTLTIYWQASNPTPGLNENWQLYDGYDSSNGRLPGAAPNYGSEVYVGLITYAQGTDDIPFVGTSDGIEIYE